MSQLESGIGPMAEVQTFPLFLLNDSDKITIFVKYCHVLYVCDYRQGVHWRLDLLTTCIHHSELHFTDH
jgi:hypothetical protein